MEIFNQLIADYGMQIIGAVVTAVATYLGIVIKNLATKFLNDKTKQDVARIVVQGIEQCYKALSGPEKLQRAIETATEMLNEKGITVTELELRILLENAVGEFNKVFQKEKKETAASGNIEEKEDWVKSELPDDEA